MEATGLLGRERYHGTPEPGASVRTEVDTGFGMWKIIDSSEGPSIGDYRARVYEIETERGGLDTVEIHLTGSVLASSDSGLSDAIVAAKQTCGRSAVEKVLSWGRPPRLITVATDWITIHHRNGYLSRIGRKLPDDPARRLEAMVSQAKICVFFGKGVEHVYEYRAARQWVFMALARGSVHSEEPRMFADVIGKLRADQRQAALDLDPEGTSELVVSQLNESEVRILRGLFTEQIDDSVEHIRIRLTRGRELTYEAVEQVLGRLWVRGYVEEFSAGRWRTTDLALHDRRRLFGPTLEPA